MVTEWPALTPADIRAALQFAQALVNDTYGHGADNDQLTPIL